MQPRRTPTPTFDASRSPAASLPTLIKRSTAASTVVRTVESITDAEKAKALRRVLLAGLLGTGVGAGTAGVAHYLNRDQLPPRDPIEDEIHLPYPQMAPPSRGRGVLAKRADVADWFVRKVLPTTNPTAGLKSIPEALQWLRGDRATHWAGVPWAVPGVVAAGGAGLGVGSHVVKEHFRKQRKGELNNQLEQAKRDYEVAMLGQYDREKLHKLGDADTKEAASRWRTPRGVAAMKNKLRQMISAGDEKVQPWHHLWTQPEYVPTAKNVRARALEARVPIADFSNYGNDRSYQLSTLLRSVSNPEDHIEAYRTRQMARPLGFWSSWAAGRRASLGTTGQTTYRSPLLQRQIQRSRDALLTQGQQRFIRGPEGQATLGMLRDISQDIGGYRRSGVPAPAELINARDQMVQSLRPRTTLGPSAELTPALTPPKTAAARPPVSLDDVCDEIEKRANNIWGAGAGGYLTLAGLLAAGTGLGTKAYLDARSRAKLMADAIKHRALLRQMQNPPDVYVTPVPSRLSAAGAVDPHVNLPDPLGDGT